MCLHCQSIKVCAFRNIATEQEHVQVQQEKYIFPREAASLATSEKHFTSCKWLYRTPPRLMTPGLQWALPLQDCPREGRP